MAGVPLHPADAASAIAARCRFADRGGISGQTRRNPDKPVVGGIPGAGEHRESGGGRLARVNTKKAALAVAGAAFCCGGARGRNRTGTPCGGGFSSHFGFRRRHADARRSWSGARLHHSLSALGARRLLSTPSEGPFGSRAWLGISSDLRPGPSPSLTGFTSGVSSGGLKFGLSPLRLPISPPGQNREAVCHDMTSCKPSGAGVTIAEFRLAPESTSRFPFIRLKTSRKRAAIILDLPRCGKNRHLPWR